MQGLHGTAMSTGLDGGEGVAFVSNGQKMERTRRRSSASIVERKGITPTNAVITERLMVMRSQKVSFKQVRKKYDVWYESNEQAFVVTKPDGMMFKYVESPEGLHYLDTEGDLGMTLVNTVAGIWSNYSNQDYLLAVQARELQIKIRRPSLWEYIKIVSDNLLPDYPVTKADIMVVEEIFGPEVGILKRKTTCRNPHAIRQVVEPLQPSIMRQYRHVTLGADVMFVNGIAFLVTVSRHIKLGTVNALVSRKQVHLLAGIRLVTQVYRHVGFKVTLALMDGEFETLCGDLVNINIALNTTAWDKALQVSVW